MVQFLSFFDLFEARNPVAATVCALGCAFVLLEPIIFSTPQYTALTTALTPAQQRVSLDMKRALKAANGIDLRAGLVERHGLAITRVQ